jgi:hypothetical protein
MQQYAAYINGDDARNRVNGEVLDDGRAIIFDAIAVVIDAVTDFGGAGIGFGAIIIAITRVRSEP